MSMTNRFPALFISHGTPMAALQEIEDAYTEALHSFFSGLPERPKAIVVVSSQGLSPEGLIEITASPRPEQLYGFDGFPQPVYEIKYPCPGSPELATQLAARLVDTGLVATLSRSSGLDHGVWMPMRAAFPDADIPVVQVSMPYPSKIETVLKLGKTLASFREEGVVLIASGGLVHNLGKILWHQKSGPAAPWAQAFEDWVFERLAEKDVFGICDFAEAAPDVELAQPSPEQFYPIFFTLGATLPGDEVTWIYREIQYSSVSMSCFALSLPKAPRTG